MLTATEPLIAAVRITSSHCPQLIPEGHTNMSSALHLSPGAHQRVAHSSPQTCCWRPCPSLAEARSSAGCQPSTSAPATACARASSGNGATLAPPSSVQGIRPDASALVGHTPMVSLWPAVRPPYGEWLTLHAAGLPDEAGQGGRAHRLQAGADAALLQREGPHSQEHGAKSRGAGPDRTWEDHTGRAHEAIAGCCWSGQS